MLLDEPTAGMDPASRRTVWKTISDAKRGRAVVLTTHFLDEADALGDRVAILHRGRLQAVGTTAQLKRQTAGAFRLTLTRPRAGGAAAEEIVAAARAHVPGAVLLAEDETELALALPQAATASFGPLFTELDARAHELGVTSCALATHSNLGHPCRSAHRLIPRVFRAALCTTCRSVTCLPPCYTGLLTMTDGLAIPTLQEVFLKITAQADAEQLEAAEAPQCGAATAAAATAAEPPELLTSTTRDVAPVAPSDALKAAPSAETPRLSGASARLDEAPPRLHPNFGQQLRMGLQTNSVGLRAPRQAACSPVHATLQPYCNPDGTLPQADCNPDCTCQVSSATRYITVTLPLHSRYITGGLPRPARLLLRRGDALRADGARLPAAAAARPVGCACCHQLLRPGLAAARRALSAPLRSAVRRAVRAANGRAAGEARRDRRELRRRRDPPPRLHLGADRRA